MDENGYLSHSLPYSFSFENSMYEWKQNYDDNIDWIKKSGGTSTINTGPTNAFDGNYYLYVEGNEFPNKRAEIISPTIDLSNICDGNFQFMYHMFGENIGSLAVQVSKDGGNSWSDNIWSAFGDKGNNWRHASFNLSAYSRELVKFKFIATTGLGEKSDIAIDNIEILSNLSYPPIVINSDEIWTNYQNLCENIIIQNSSKLTIKGTTALPYQATITVKNNSELIVDNSQVINSNIIVEHGGKLTLKNNGIIVQHNDETIINSGGLFNFNCGEIKIIKK